MTCLLCPSKVSASGGSSGNLDHEATSPENLINALCQFLLLPLDPWSFTLNGRNANHFLTSYCTGCVDRMKHVHALWKQFEEIQLQIITLRRDVEQKLIQADLVSNNQLRKQLINALSLSQLGIPKNGGTSASEIINVENVISTGGSESQIGNHEVFSYAEENSNKKQFITIIDPTELQSDNMLYYYYEYEIPILTSSELQSESAPDQDEVQDNDPVRTPSSSNQAPEFDDNYENNSRRISKSQLPIKTIKRRRNKPFTPISQELKDKLKDEIESTKGILQVKMKHMRWDEDPKPPEPDPNNERCKRKYRSVKECNDGNEVFRCPQCSSNFDTARRRDTHVLRNHKGDKLSYKCKHCGKGFPADRQCLEHERRHTGEKPYQCEQCGKTFRTNRLLQNHIGSHEENTQGTSKFSCSVCRKVLHGFQSLNVHMKIHTNQKDFCCQHCGDAFCRKADLERHQLKKHPKFYDVSNNPEYKCKICGKVFIDKVYVRQHEKLHIGQDIPFSCSLCKYKCFGKYRFDIHMARHENKKEFKCTYQECSAAFNTEVQLRSHQYSIHAGERPFWCSYCEKDFKRRADLKVHEALHDNVKNFKCPVCGTDFVLRSYMLRCVDKHKKEGTLPEGIGDLRTRKTEYEFKPAPIREVISDED